MTRAIRPTLSILVFGSILFVSSQAYAVYQCDGEENDCQCGKDNPFPCSCNGGKCTWWAWESACCAWGAPALPTYGDAWHWAVEAQAAGWPVRSTPKVGTVFVRTIGGGDCGGHDCGSVGWVISVDGNGGFCATEMACSGWYGVRTNCHLAGYADGGFICKKGTACEDPSPTCSTEVTSGGETVIDDLNPCFTRYGTPSYWWEASIGYAGHMWFTYATDDPTDNYGVWTLKVRDAQNYEVYAYIPENNATTHQAKYRIHHNGKDNWVTINQNDISAQFVSLGTYDFSAGGDQYIRLDDSTGEDYNTYKRKVGFDAVKLVYRPSCIPNCSGKECGDDGCGGSCGECPAKMVCVKDETMSTASCVPCVDCESLDSGVEVYDSATGESSMEPDSLGDLASLSDFPTEFPATRDTAGTLETLPAEQIPDQGASLPEISQSGGTGGGCAALGVQDAGTCPLWLFVLVLGLLRFVPRAVPFRLPPHAQKGR